MLQSCNCIQISTQLYKMTTMVRIKFGQHFSDVCRLTSPFISIPVKEDVINKTHNMFCIAQYPVKIKYLFDKDDKFYHSSTRRTRNMNEDFTWEVK